MERLAYLIVLITLLASGAFAQIEFNDSSDIQFRTGLEMNSNTISGLSSPGSPGDAVPKSYVDAYEGSQGFPSVLEFNSTANQTIYMDTNQIVGLPNASASSEPVTLSQLGSEVVNRSGDSMTGNLDMNGNDILNAAYINTEGDINLTQSGDPILNYKAYENSDYGMFLRYDSNFSGDTSDNRLVLGTENNGNEYPVLTAEREGSGLNLHRDVKMLDSDSFVMEQPNDPRMNVRLQEAPERGAFFRYDSNFSGDTSDNRVVIGTRGTGTDYPAISAERNNGKIYVHRGMEVVDGNEIRLQNSPDPQLDYQAYESSGYGAFFRYDSNFSGDDTDNRAVLATEDSGNEYVIFTADRDGDWIDLERPFQDNVDVRKPSVSDPELNYYMQESDNYGAHVRYVSNYSGDTSDNRLVLGTENAGTDYEVLSAEREGSWAKIHRDTNISGDLYVDGSLSGVSVGGSASGLSEVLEVNNTANQTIEFDSDTGVQVGDGSTSTASNSDIAIGDGASVSQTDNDNAGIAIGKGADSKAYYGIALGQGAEADSTSNTISIGYQANQGNSCQYCVAVGDSSDSGFYGTVLGYGADVSSAQRATAVGEGSEVTGDDAVAIGSESSATADNSIAIGGSEFSGNTGASASAKAAVAIGNQANAPNPYEATFGNLSGGELDLNVTGNATIHGSGGLNVPSDQGIEIGDSDTETDIGSGIAIGKGATANESSASGEDNIALGAGAEASAVNQGVALGPSTVASASNSVALGTGDSEASSAYAISLGANSQATGQSSVAIGGGSTLGGAGPVSAANTDSVALGAGSSASADGAVAIGAESSSSQIDTARFGSGSRPYDINVSGNAVIQGSYTEIRGDPSGDPVLDYRLQEGDDYGGYIKYDSQFDGDTSDNRIVIGTEDSGTDSAGLTVNRSTRNVEIPNGNLSMAGNDINNVGTLNANTKNFVQDVNGTHEIVYTSSESGEVVVEWSDSVNASTEGIEVKLPDYLREVMSSEDDYHVITTSVNSLANTGVFNKTDSGFTLKASKDTEVDFHVRGVRKGFEDKEILREK